MNTDVGGTLQSRLRMTPGPALAISAGLVILGAEISGWAFGAIPGAIVDAGLASALLIVCTWRPGTAAAPLLIALALVALIRPISLAAAVPALGPLAWYALAGVPLLVGAALAARLMTEPVSELHLHVLQPRLDVGIQAVGVVAGLVGAFVLKPAPLLAHPNALGYAAMAIILVVFGGALEELIFRGLLQHAAGQVLGSEWMGIAYGAGLGAALYAGSGSVPYMLLMATVGSVFGLAFVRGASIWGLALSHGLMLVVMALLAQ